MTTLGNAKMSSLKDKIETKAEAPVEAKKTVVAKPAKPAKPAKKAKK